MLPNQDKHVSGFAETLRRAVFFFASNLDAVVNHAAQNAGFTMQAQFLGDAYPAVGPIERVRGAGFDAQLALDANAGVLVDGDSPFWVAVVVLVFGCF